MHGGGHHEASFEDLEGSTNKVHEMDVSWIPPHLWLHFLYTVFPAEFKRRVLGPPGALAEFLARVKPDDPRLLQHPARNRPNLRTKGIPIMIHGDGVPCTSGSTLDCLSWQSIPALKRTGGGQFRSTMDFIWLISAIFTKCYVDSDKNENEDTKAMLWMNLIHSLLQAEEGVGSKFRLDGSRIKRGQEGWVLAGETLAGGYFSNSLGLKVRRRLPCQALPHARALD